MMDEELYYYMSVAWTPKNSTQHKIIGRITDKHPLQAMIDVNDQSINDGEFVLIHWNVLTKNDFDRFVSNYVD